MNTSVGPETGRSAAVGKSIHASQSGSQERMFFDSGAGVLATSAPIGERRHPLGIEEFGLRHLKTFSEIQEILYLREAIDLSVHSHAHLALEKKETSVASSGRSNCAGKS